MAPNSSRKRSRWSRKFPYSVDYNDHFETPKTAYEDILPIIDILYPSRKRTQLRIYDPYYCNGRTAVLLRETGFDKVIHECRDFYEDQRNKRIPQHDVFITNPPYSDDHKERCLGYALDALKTEGRPFFVLLPNYVAARDYYRNLLKKKQADDDVVYVIPSSPYEYDHPEGTGHEVSPFASIWYCGVGKTNVCNIQQQWESRKSSRLATSLTELQKLQAIPTQKRPNPRQRRKKKKLMSQANDGSMENRNSNPSVEDTKPSSSLPSSKRKNSRYRDEEGKRVKKRF